MGRILQLIFEILAIFSIFYFGFRAWRRADVKEKLAKAQEVESEFETVSKFQKNHKEIAKKSEAVSKFKKTDF